MNSEKKTWNERKEIREFNEFHRKQKQSMKKNTNKKTSPNVITTVNFLPTLETTMINCLARLIIFIYRDITTLLHKKTTISDN